MKKLILMVSCLTLIGAFLHAQPVPNGSEEGRHRGEPEVKPVAEPVAEPDSKMLPPEALNIGLLESIEYPSWAYRKNIQGEVKVRVRVDAQGSYVKHEIMYTPDLELAEEVCRHIPALQFLPAQSGDRPVEGWTAISVFFEIPQNARSRQAGVVKVGYAK